MRRCPICKKEVTERAPHRPFCSARCKDVDLGNWLNEAYRITRPMSSNEQRDALEELERDELN